MIKILFFSENILYKLICDLIKIRFRCTRKKLKNEEIQRDVKDNYECDDRLRKIFSDLSGIISLLVIHSRIEMINKVGPFTPHLILAFHQINLTFELIFHICLNVFIFQLFSSSSKTNFKSN